MYTGYVTKVDKKIRKALNIPIRKRFRKATVSMVELEKIFEAMANYLKENGVETTQIAFTLNQSDDSRSGEITSLDFEIGIKAEDAGQKNLLPDKLAIDISNDDNPDPADLEIPSQIANEINSDQDDEPPYESSFAEKEQPAAEPEAEDSTDDPFSDFQEDSDAFNLDDDDEALAGNDLNAEAEVESDSTTTAAQSEPDEQSEVLSTSMDQTENVNPEPTNSSDSPENIPDKPKPDKQIISLDQYLNDLTANQASLQLSKKDILADYGLPESREDIKSDNTVALAKFDFISGLIRSRQTDLTQWQTDFNINQAQLLADLKEQLTIYYQQNAAPDLIEDLVEKQVSQIVDVFNKEVLQPNYIAANKEIATTNKKLIAGIKKQLKVDQDAAVAKLADEAQVKLDQAQKDYELGDQALRDDMQNKAKQYRSEQIVPLQKSIQFDVNQKLNIQKNKLCKEFQANNAELTAEYLKKISTVRTEIQVNLDQNEQRFETNALKQRELDLANQKQQQEWDYKNKQLDSQVEIAKAQAKAHQQTSKQSKQVVTDQGYSESEAHVLKLYDQLFEKYGKLMDRQLTTEPPLAAPAPAPQVTDPQAPIVSDPNQRSSNSKKGLWSGLTAAGACLVLLGGFGLYHHENAKISQLSAINSQLSSQLYKVKQKPTTPVSKAATVKPKKASLDDLLAQKDYQKAMDDYNDLNSLDKIAERLYLNKDTANLELLNSKYDVALGKYNHAILKNDQSELQKSASQLTDFEKSLMNQDQKKFLSPGK